MDFKFKKPTEAEERRMTVASVHAALNAFKTKRRTLTKDLDEQIEYFEKLLERKRGEAQSA